MWPWGCYGTLLGEAEAAGAGARVLVRYPIGASDVGAASHVAAVLEDIVARLAAGGIQVEVGAWAPGTEPR